MRRRPSIRQRGTALIVFATVLVLGIAWYTVGALGKAARTDAEREIRTGLALQAAKRALLGYVALKAADNTENFPGRLPCPETPSQFGTADEGVAAPIPGYATCASTGRLPWRTLGIDQPRDGYGEALWYVVTTGAGGWALLNSGTTLMLNPNVQGTLQYNGQPNTAVALIIAPGAALNTMNDPATPAAPCAKVNQFVANRYTAPLNPANFLECGNVSGPQYANPGSSQWSNDRVIAITAAEVMDAIAGPVADRIQRQVMPALESWRTTESGNNWPGAQFLPYASSFSDPTANDLCGDAGVRAGLLPVHTTASCIRGTAASASVLGLVQFPCTQSATSAQCSFQRLFGTAPFSATITVTAPVALGFRRPVTAAEITVSNGGQVVAGSLSSSYNSGTELGRTQFDVSWPVVNPSQTVTVTIPHPPASAFLSTAAMAWFVDNNWARYAYYAVTPAGTTGGPACTPGTDCLTVNGLPTGTGNANDKRVVLALMGRAVGAQVQPSNSPTDYLESMTSATVFNQDRITSTFNDRLAACPFQYTPLSGTPVSVCN